MSIPRPEFVMREISGLVPLVHSALDHGVFKAKDFFDNQENVTDRAINKSLAPNLVRFYALQELKRSGQDAYEDSVGVDFPNIPNNGIHISYDNYEIKILKSNRGEIPVPGNSKSRRNFYDQPELLNHTINQDDNVDHKNINLNLLLLWDVITPYNLDILTLACPKQGDKSRDSVEAHWHCRIPDKILLGKYEISETIEVEEILDLPLKDKKIDEIARIKNV
jgi:hypothetical protein